MTLRITIFRDWCIELWLDRGSVFTEKRLRIGKKWPATFPNWYVQCRISGCVKAGTCLAAILLLAGCSAFRAKLHDQGYERMSALLHVDTNDDAAVRAAAYNDPVMVGAFGAVSDYLGEIRTKRIIEKYKIPPPDKE